MKIQIICDKRLADEWGNNFKPKVTACIQSPGRGVGVTCISDQEAPRWLRKEIEATSPNASEIEESTFVMPADEFRELAKKYPTLWFGIGKKLTPAEIEEYINLFKK